MPILEKIEGRNPNCEQCHGKGLYYYDEHHGTICNFCCPHDAGWIELKGEAWGRNQGKELCERGCGTLRPGKKYRMIKEQSDRMLKESDLPEVDKVILDQGLFIVKCRYCDYKVVIGSLDMDSVCNNLSCLRNRIMTPNKKAEKGR